MGRGDHAVSDKALSHPDWFKPYKALYPFDTRRLTLRSGHTMSYVDLPSRIESSHTVAPTVMVHGNPTWSFYYRNLLTAVSEVGGRALALDHIGCGFSDKPDDRAYQYTLSQRVDDLEEWLDSLGLGEEQINLVVHDWGGMIGMAYAARYPQRINKIVVLNTSAFHIPGDKRLPFTLWLGRNTRLGQVLIQGLNAFSGLATRWACMKPLSKQIARAYTAPYHSWATRVATHRFVKDIPLHRRDLAYQVVEETQAKLPTLTDKPMLIGWGLKDFVFDHTFLKIWKSRFPDAESHIYPESGHYILEDEESDLIPKIVNFLYHAPHPA